MGATSRKIEVQLHTREGWPGMPARILPDKTTLRRLLERGLSHQEIAEWVYRETGHKVPRSTVAAAIQRAGLAAPRNRYTDVLPWRVKQEHLMHYAPRMLRLLGRKKQGLPLTPAQEERLESWLNKLEEDEAVVVYLPDTDEGFHYVWGQPDEKGVPIKKNALV